MRLAVLVVALALLAGCYASHTPDVDAGASSCSPGDRCRPDQPCWCRLEHMAPEHPWARCFACLEACGPPGPIEEPGHCELF